MLETFKRFDHFLCKQKISSNLSKIFLLPEQTEKDKDKIVEVNELLEVFGSKI